MRLFVAVDISETIATAIEDAQKELRQAGADVAWVKPANLHLTLKFLGDTPEARLNDVKSALDLVAPQHAAFDMKLYDLGCFPDRGAPRVVWAGVTDGREPLAALSAAVDKSLGELGIPREMRPFVAHLTLGRVRSPRGADRLRKRIEERAGAGFGACRVEAVRLYQSTLAPGGSIYSVVHTAALK
jgi:2'-5' RNA ligase